MGKVLMKPLICIVDGRRVSEDLRFRLDNRRVWATPTSIFERADISRSQVEFWLVRPEVLGCDKSQINSIILLDSRFQSHVKSGGLVISGCAGYQEISIDTDWRDAGEAEGRAQCWEPLFNQTGVNFQGRGQNLVRQQPKLVRTVMLPDPVDVHPIAVRHYIGAVNITVGLYPAAFLQLVG